MNELSEIFRKWVSFPFKKIQNSEKGAGEVGGSKAIQFFFFQKIIHFGEDGLPSAMQVFFHKVFLKFWATAKASEKLRILARICLV